MAWLEKYRGYVVGALLAIIATGAVFLYLRREEPGPVRFVPTPLSTPVSSMKVYVTGAVVRPGVYSLKEGDRVQQAIDAAGGTTAQADLERVNLAAHVRDEQQVDVPEKGEGAAPAPAEAASQRININTASAAELDSLPGIGPAYAQRIVDFRQTKGPFNGVEDIKAVPGISDSVFEKIKDRITT